MHSCTVRLVQCFRPCSSDVSTFSHFCAVIAFPVIPVGSLSRVHTSNTDGTLSQKHLLVGILVLLSFQI